MYIQIANKPGKPDKAKLNTQERVTGQNSQTAHYQDIWQCN